jgi:hypothetical protein
MILTVLAPVFALLTTVAAPDAQACGPDVEAVRVGNDVLCTHGDDEPPPGVDTTELPTTEELLEARFGVETPAAVAAETQADDPYVAASNTVKCFGDGIAGPRVQLIYARASDENGRYKSVLPLIRQYAADADDIINVSAGRVGDGRRIRFVHQADCLPRVLNLELSRSGDDSFGNMVSELRDAGMTSPDRKYLVFMDAAVGICGLGEIYPNDDGGQTNPNNSGPAMYARVDTSCWQHAAAHELLHTLGAVQNSAPNSTGAGHCTDEVDVMCYKDTPNTETRQVCNRAGQVDCNNNDYFHPNPRPLSYLARKWNVARSRYLASGAPPPRPVVTSVTVPSSVVPGSPAQVRADTRTSDAKVVWSSTRKDCWFAAPRAKVTSWACPATARGGDARITVNVTENGITTPYENDVSVVIPQNRMSSSGVAAVSDGKIRVGRSTAVRGRFIAMATGANVPGLKVRLQARPKGKRSWDTVASRPTSRRGKVRFVVEPRRNMAYRLRAVRNSSWSPESSPRRDVTVKAKLLTKVNSRTVVGMTTTKVRDFGRIRIAGKVTPDKAGRKIKLRLYRDGRWRTIREKRINRDSRFVFKYKPRRDGKHRLKIVKPDDRRNGGSSQIVRIRVR